MDAHAHLDLAAPLFALGHLSEAEAAARKAASIKEDFSQAWVRLATIQSARGQTGSPLRSILKATRIEPKNVDYRIRLGEILLDQGHTDHSIKIFKLLLREYPDHLNAIGGLAHAFERQGEIDKAYETIAPHIDTIKVHARIGTVWGIVCRRKKMYQQGIDVLTRMLQHPVGTIAKALLLQELGALYDTTGQQDQAFSAYTEANSLRSGTWDTENLELWVDRMIETFTPELFASNPAPTAASTTPILIVGMPRSGTSLVEQILSSHSAVFAAGELEDMRATSLLLESLAKESFPECMNKSTPSAIHQMGAWYTSRRTDQDPQALAVTDKMPQNFQYLGLAAMSLPNVRIIHCVRNPMDTALSCYFQGFKEALCWSNKVEWLGPYIQQYQRLMKHWHSVLPVQIHEVHYEELVVDPEPHIRKLTDFCGLDWDPRVLSHHESTRSIATASYAQANQPIYKSSVGKSDRYAKHLQPLLPFLEVE
jgi:Tfp pilus assembly protein PilF